VKCGARSDQLDFNPKVEIDSVYVLIWELNGSLIWYDFETSKDPVSILIRKPPAENVHC